MRTYILAVIILLGFISCTKKEAIKTELIPQPTSIRFNNHGTFHVSEKTPIIVSNNELIPLAELFNSYLNRLGDIDLNITNGSCSADCIVFEIKQGLDKEGYKIEVGDNVVIQASNYNGMTKGVATLVQMLDCNGKVRIPAVSISDNPDYAYRTVMLDLARFWHPLETIKETIDLLWLYKIPYLHLHLSDNRRFTFPMNEFPDLQIVNRDGSREYYTRQELDDLVEYAKQRGISIIPEIDLPGHSSQLWQKYPEVFGSVDPKTGKAKSTYVINMAKDKTYEACEKIIKQLAEVFYTSPYIHFGGDEVYLEALKSVPEYKPFCQKHKLTKALNGDANELFCYFIKRLNEMVKANGKKSIIWEGFHGTGAGSQTIPKEIPVIVWNTTYNHPDSLVKNGYDIINSTWIPWYHVGAMNLAAPQEKGYNWDVTKWAHWNKDIPNVELETKNNIRGGQICYWEQNHFKVIPVLKESVPVLSERLWNNKAQSSFGDFQNRFKKTNALYESLFQPVKIEASGLLSESDQRFDKPFSVSLKSSSPGIIKYHVSDSWNLPDMKNGNIYQQAFNLNESSVLTVQLFNEQGKAIGFPVQKYYQKIEPAYHYTVYGGAPQHGWNEMPDFATLPVVRQGQTGFMSPERLKKINAELFARVKAAGHIDVRFQGIYNPYAVELKGKINIPVDQEYTFRIQTHDGLAELYIDGAIVGKGTEFKNKAEDFTTSLKAGEHNFAVRYFYKQIQNQLSIEYKTSGMDEYKAFEALVQPIN